MAFVSYRCLSVGVKVGKVTAPLEQKAGKNILLKLLARAVVMAGIEEVAQEVVAVDAEGRRDSLKKL